MRDAPKPRRSTSPRPRRTDRLAFLMQSIRHPLQVGSVIPSSSHLERRVIEAADLDSAHTIVELGPGTGGMTHALLRAMHPDARLLSIEINPRFHAMIDRIPDERLIAHPGSACELRDCLDRYDLNRPKVVISGIPFSTMSRRDGTYVVEEISSLLASEGRFVAYQLNGRVAALTRPVMGKGQASLELRNIPPMRIYTWHKNGV